MSTIRALNAGAPGAGTTTELMPSLAKAWINFDGTGTTNRASFNVSSRTDNATGEDTLIFTNSFASSNYMFSSAAGGGSTSSLITLMLHNENITSFSLHLYCAARVGSSFIKPNPTFGFVSVQGDLA